MAETINTSTLTFLSDLSMHNTREWFAQNKNRYEAARKNYIAFLDELLVEVHAFDPVAYGQQGKDLVFRIYRDVRFSNDKRPYKDHFGAYLAEGGRKSVLPGYYLHLAANNNSFIAGGLWMPPAAELKAVRQEIDYNLEQFRGIVEAPEFKKHFSQISGEQLKTTPKGYDKDNPAIEYLRFKSWNAVKPIPDAVVLSNDFMQVVLEAMRVLQPFNKFLRQSLQDNEV